MDVWLLSLIHISHQPAAFGQSLQRLQRFLHGLGIQRAETLVDEHGIDLHTACIALNHVRKAQCQTQRRLKGLAAGQAAHTAHLAGIIVQHIQIQRALAPAVGPVVAQKFELAVGHAHKAPVGRGDGVFEMRRQHILLELLAAKAPGQGSVGRAVQLLNYGGPVLHLSLIHI